MKASALLSEVDSYIGSSPHLLKKGETKEIGPEGHGKTLKCRFCDYQTPLEYVSENLVYIDTDDEPGFARLKNHCRGFHNKEYKAIKKYAYNSNFQLMKE